MPSQCLYTVIQVPTLKFKLNTIEKKSVNNVKPYKCYRNILQRNRNFF